jgi:hypothetical protein
VVAMISPDHPEFTLKSTTLLVHLGHKLNSGKTVDMFRLLGLPSVE